MVDADLEVAYTRAGQGSFNLRNFPDHWSGRETLKEEDYVFIDSVSPLLVDNARACGTNHPEFVKTVMGQFIYEKHVEALSSDALLLLAAEELKQPTENRPVNQWGATILTNAGHLANMRQKALDKAVAKALAVEAADVVRIQKEIEKAKAVEKRESIRAKKVELEHKQKTEANYVYSCYKQDEELGTQTMMNLQATILKSAYKFFVKVNLPTTSIAASRKPLYLSALREAYALHPAE